MAKNDEFNRVKKIAEKAGWRIEQARGGHLKWKGPNGALVFSASTPGDHRAVKNHISQLRKHGLTV